MTQYFEIDLNIKYIPVSVNMMIKSNKLFLMTTDRSRTG